MTNKCTPKLDAALREWNTPTFNATLKRELERLERGVLPLDRCLSRGSVADEGDYTVMVLNSRDDERAIHARVGVFFNEIDAGCSCGDEPASLPAYCEMHIVIDKVTAITDIAVMPE